jgi:urease accessory protein
MSRAERAPQLHAPMGWKGQLSLHYRLQQGRTVALDRHSGPLRVLQRLYPEGDAICHHVLVHPPGGLVGGDELQVDVQLDEGAHALITTPGATRYYRSEGLPAAQRVSLQLAAGARLEWLPLESIAHPGCEGCNQVTLDLAAGAEMMGWDLLALGLPASSAPFDSGSFTQHLHWPGIWLERARLQAQDRALLQGPVGLAGHTVVATLWWASANPLPPAARQRLLDGARQAVGESPLAATAGCTAPDERLVLLRLLAHRVEPAMALLQAVRAVWRSLQWGLQPQPPRLWRT